MNDDGLIQLPNVKRCKNEDEAGRIRNGLLA